MAAAIGAAALPAIAKEVLPKLWTLGAEIHKEVHDQGCISKVFGHLEISDSPCQSNSHKDTSGFSSVVDAHYSAYGFSKPPAGIWLNLRVGFTVGTSGDASRTYGDSVPLAHAIDAKDLIPTLQSSKIIEVLQATIINISSEIVGAHVFHGLGHKKDEEYFKKINERINSAILAPMLVLFTATNSKPAPSSAAASGAVDAPPSASRATIPRQVQFIKLGQQLALVHHAHLF